MGIRLPKLFAKSVSPVNLGDPWLKKRIEEVGLSQALDDYTKRDVENDHLGRHMSTASQGFPMDSQLDYLHQLNDLNKRKGKRSLLEIFRPSRRSKES